MDNKNLRSDEKIIYALRSLYHKYGYLPFNMSKFEEYDLYVKNKEFLVSDSVITFNDTNGKLLALKPDVTLSIIKNTADAKDVVEKVYYNENVYRVWGSTHSFKEIMQTGLECIGNIGLYDVFEVVILGARSLALISDKFVIELSHLGIISSIIDYACKRNSFKNKIMSCLKQKSSHEIEKICHEYGIDEEKTKILCQLCTLYGDSKTVIDWLEGLNIGEELDNALSELKELCALIDKTEYKDSFRLDFSLVNDMSYYNGIVFNGFVEGVFEAVLFGGRYDNLLSKMDKKEKGGIGFAVYVDLLEGLYSSKRDYDVDVLVLYSDNTPASKVSEAVEREIALGKSASAQKSENVRLRYRELLDLREE